MEKVRWVPNRAGLFNFWYYDEQIFNFSNGKMLLRGANGSGKSVTMQSFIPVLLDGRKSPDRLDPFGSKARRMEDYLLGEKDVVDHDERTGYLFMEYKMRGSEKYITTGIGMQAKRNKGLKSWYFIIKDNRRIGIDFFLYQKKFNEKIPLSAKELENRIAGGGYVVHSQKEYMELVNKYVYGYSSIEAFEDLIKLLIQLRSPKLSKEYRPTAIYDILESALPPLTDDELRHLSDTIESMDQTTQQLEQLERESESVERLRKVYHQYNQFILAERAQKWEQAQQKVETGEKKVRVLFEQYQELEQSINELENEQIKLEERKSVAEQEKENLERHEVWSLEKRKREKRDEAERLSKELELLEAKSTKLNKNIRNIWEERDKTEAALSRLKGKEVDLLDDLSFEGQVASFPNHEVNVESFKRKVQEEFDFSIWLNEAKDHQALLYDLEKRIERIKQLTDRNLELERKSSEQKFVVDELQKELDHLENWFDEELQKLEVHIFQWIQDHPKLEYSQEHHQTIARAVQGLYSESRFETVRNLLLEAIHTYEAEIKSRISITAKNMSSKRQEISLAEDELERIKTQKMIDPERATGTEQFRRKLVEEGKAFLPFYAAVEFRDHVTEEERERLEAALMRVGILDSLITDQRVTPLEDAVLIPEPKVFGYTLADYLMPDLDEDAPISEVLVDEVLRSIPLEREDGGFHINADGSYSIGSLVGHAPDVGAAKYIGRSSRKRHQREQILLWTEKIAQLEKEYAQLQQELSLHQEELALVDEWKRDLPKDDVLREVHEQILDKKGELRLAQEILSNIDEEWKQVHLQLTAEKQGLKERGRQLNIALERETISEALQAASKYIDYLNELKNISIEIGSHVRILQTLKLRVEELEEALQENMGEQNWKSSQLRKITAEIEAIERQLQLKGIDEVRERIQQVQKELTETEARLHFLYQEIPAKNAKLISCKEKLDRTQTEVEFWTKMADAWKDLVEREKSRGFFVIPDGNAKGIYQQFGNIMEKYDKPKILELLTKAFYSEQDYLTEYRLVEYPEEIDTPSWFSEQYGDQYEPFKSEWTNNKRRMLIEMEYRGQRVSPYFVGEKLQEELEETKNLLDEQDRQLYEDIIVNTVGTILRRRIQRAERWVKQMDKIMSERDTSSGLTFSISWKPLTAESEDELDTKDLVQLLQRNSKFLNEEDLEKITKHFRSRIAKAKELIQMGNEGNTLHQVLKEVLDYRKWFTFILYYTREGEPKRELTNNAFYRFSGGEKAMAMYIPLFAAAYSRYEEAGNLSPYLISLDEAFAGVDENNIRDMFEVVEQLGFDYIMNSQILWGDYDTISSLAIYELIRPKNANYVSVIRYHWDGQKRSLVMDDWETKDSNTKLSDETQAHSERVIDEKAEEIEEGIKTEQQVEKDGEKKQSENPEEKREIVVQEELFSFD